MITSYWVVSAAINRRASATVTRGAAAGAPGSANQGNNSTTSRDSSTPCTFTPGICDPPTRVAPVPMPRNNARCGAGCSNSGSIACRWSDRTELVPPLRKRPLTSRYRAPKASSTTLAVTIGPSRTGSRAYPQRNGDERRCRRPDKCRATERDQEQVTQRYRNDCGPCAKGGNDDLRRQQRRHRGADTVDADRPSQ